MIPERRRPAPAPGARDDRLAYHIEAVSQNTGSARNASVTLVLASLYLVIAALSVTHEQLLRQSPLELPIVKMWLPLVWFFVLTPLLLFVLHLQLLIKLRLLGKSLRETDKLIRSLPPMERDEARSRIPAFKFNVMLVGDPDPGLLTWLIRGATWLTMALFPPYALMVVHAGFLPFHGWIPWYHLGLVLADVLMIFLLWPQAVRNPDTPVHRRWYAAGLALSVLAILACSGGLRLINGDLAVRDVVLAQKSEEPVIVAAMLQRDPALTVDQARRQLDTPINLSERDLENADLSGCEFLGADLSRINLAGGALVDANLRDAQLFEAALTDANLDQAVLRNAGLHFIQADGISLFHVDLRGANLEGAEMGGAELMDSDLRYADLGSAVLTGADMPGTDLRGTTMSFTDLRGANLLGADLRGAYLQYCDLRGADLTGAKLYGAVFESCEFANADLRFADTTPPPAGQWEKLVRATLENTPVDDLAWREEQFRLGREAWDRGVPVALLHYHGENSPCGSKDMQCLETERFRLLAELACQSEYLAEALLLQGAARYTSMSLYTKREPDLEYGARLCKIILDSGCETVQAALQSNKELAEAVAALQGE